MSFIPEQPKQKKLADQYLKFVPGIPVSVQILDDQATLLYRHWIKTSDKPKGFPVTCLGYNQCPICIKNRSLGENAREHPDYIPSLKRFMVNVLDVTLCKKSPKTNEVFYGVVDARDNLIFPVHDSEGNSLTELPVEPANEVRILERGPDLFEKKLRPLLGRVKNSSGKVLEITEFVMELVTEGSGRDTNITPFPLVGDPRTVNAGDYQDKKIDLTAGLRLNSDEIMEILNGSPLSDILAARKAAEQLNINVETTDEIPY